jgi:hypothetical protein
MAKKTKKKAPVEVIAQQPPKVPEEAVVMSQIERLSKIGTDYADKLNAGTLKGLYQYFGSLTVAEISAKLKSPSLTAFERSVIIHIAKINSTSKDGMEAIKYLHDRGFGKMETKLEHTGIGGGPIKVEENVALKIERAVAKMTDAELDAFEESMFAVGSALDESDETDEN